MNLLRSLAKFVQGADDLARDVGEPLNPLIAFCVSLLPRRYWAGVNGVGILLSGLFQVGVCFLLLFATYLTHTRQVGDALADVTIAAAIEEGAQSVNAAPAMALGALTPFSLFAVSLPAWVYAYGVLSGLVRLLGYAADHPCGDPILTIVDGLVWDAGHALRSALGALTSRLRSFWNI